MNNTERSNAADACAVAVIRNSTVVEQAKAGGHYDVVCRGPREELRAEYNALVARAAEYIAQGHILRGNLLLESTKDMLEDKWVEPVENLVTTVGGNFLLDTGLAGAAYTAAWYLGLISATGYTTGPDLADTMAVHGGWAEDVNYSQATRPAPSWGAAAAKAKATTATLFSINGATTIKGCFLNTVNTKGGNLGTLYSAGLFTGGDRIVAPGDSINVTYTASV